MAKVKLTQNYVNNLPPVPTGKSKEEHCDITFPGLLAEQRATNDEWFTYRLRYKNPSGKTSYIQIGRSCEITLAEARQKAKLIKADILANGADPQAAVREKRNAITWSRYMNTIYIPHVTAHLRSYKNLVSLNTKYVEPEFGHLPLTKITLGAAQKLHRSMIDVHGLSPASADHLAKFLRQSMNYAALLDLIPSSPVSKIRLFNICNREERLMTNPQLKKLMAILDTDKNRTVCLAIKFLYFTGARVSEVLHARHDEISIASRTWTIQATNSKSKQRRSVPLSDAAITVLEELKSKDKSEWLFTSRRGGRLTTIGKVWIRLRREADLEGTLKGGLSLRLHDHRHAAASAMISSGQSLYSVQKILGHSDPSVTQRYAHMSTEALQDAANSIGLYVEKALAESSDT
jgi:site-specific recombinase XerD